MSTKPADKIIMQDLLETTCIKARLSKRKKDLLFEEFANTFAEALPELSARDILAALMDRERSQNTAVGHGVALPHATINAAKRTHLGIFTSAEPIDYQAPDGEGVQVFFVTIGPASERQTHLHLLAMVSTLALKTELLPMLIEAESTEEISQAVVEAQKQLPAKDRAPSVTG
jgi:PTS system nitrogen regulatory IIA component